MENKPFNSIINNSQAPFINSLILKGSLLTNYHAITNPSLPNYLALIGGSTFNITSDCTNCFINQSNLVDSLENKNLTWKGYLESMPKSCFLGNSYPYAQKHNPFIYFDDIRKNDVRYNNIVPLSNLDSDLKTYLPNFILIIPNLCNDMHDCSISEGDKFLAQLIPKITSSGTLKNKNYLLILTWDEGNITDNKISTIIIGSNIKPGFKSDSAYNHYSLLHTIEQIWDLASMTQNDKDSPIISDIFNN